MTAAAFAAPHVVTTFWIGAAGTVLGGFGLDSVAEVHQTPDGRRLRLAPEEWFRYTLDGTATRTSGYPCRRSSGGRYRTACRSGPPLGAYFLEFVRIGVTAAGQVTITGRYSVEMGALLDAKFDEDPFGWLRHLPERLVAGHESTPSRAQHDHLPVTRRNGV